ncbi:MAG TPA: hypothetical protein VLX31_01875 [Streptosporangiaceae bacterium]|nr:hypothetical protein [Streptosporangiaceae bacterium]
MPDPTNPPPTDPESSPCPATEPVLAIDVRAGDVLDYDGRQLAVTADPAFISYHDQGRPVNGLVIECRDGSARWYLYRQASDLLARVRAGGAE